MKKSLLVTTVLILGSCASPEPEQHHPTTDKSVDSHTVKQDTSLSEDMQQEIAEKATEGFIQVTGPRNIADVEGEVKTHLISLNYWYSQWENRRKEPHHVVVQFTISDLGVPSNVTVLHSTMDSGGTEKIAHDVTEWRFSRLRESLEKTTVTYPIELSLPQQLEL